MTATQKRRIKKWVETLRSGKYRQGVGMLRQRDNSYCCLGVACDIAAKDLHMKWMQRGGEYEFGGRDVVLPPRVARYYGLEIPDPGITYPRGELLSCTEANDGWHDGKRNRARWSFKAIADGLEREYLK